MTIETIDSKGFIQAISQEHPSLIIFRTKSSEHNKKINEIDKHVQSLMSDMPKACFFQYIVDDNSDNEHLATTIEIPKGLSIVMFKDGCFSRYQLNPHQLPNLKKIWNAAKTKNRSILKSVEAKPLRSSDFIRLEM